MSLISRFVMNAGPTPGREILLEKPEMFIGRELTNDIVINDGEVSRRHARVFSQGNQYAIEDLGSTNGTFLNGERLMGPMILRPGMVVSFGEQVSLVFEMVQPPADATIAAPMMRPPVQPPVQAPPIYAPAPVQPPQPAVYGQPLPQQPPVYGQPLPQQPGYPTYPPQQQPGYAPPPPAYPPQQAYPPPTPGAQTPAYGYYQEPYPAQAQAPVGYAGQVPLPPEEEAPRRRLPGWAMITLIVVGVLLVFCIIALLIIDSSRSNWCALFGPFFNAVQANTCP